MTLLLGFVGHYSINLAIYCACMLIVTFVSLMWLKKQDREPGILSVLAIISFLVSMVSFVCIKDPAIYASTVAMSFGTITAFTSVALLILPPFVITLVNAPSKIKERRNKRAAERKVKAEIEIKLKTHISDL